MEDWRLAVYRSRLSGSVKVLLLRMADHMRTDRKVSVPRTQLARELGVHEQRVAERIKVAVGAGWLSKVSGGYRGATATYQGLFPGEEWVRVSGTHSGTESVRATSTHSTPETGTHATPEWVPDGGYATTTAELFLPRQPSDVGSKEESHTTVGDDLPPDWWLREPPDYHAVQGATA